MEKELCQADNQFSTSLINDSELFYTVNATNDSHNNYDEENSEEDDEVQIKSDMNKRSFSFLSTNARSLCPKTKSLITHMKKLDVSLASSLSRGWWMVTN